MELQTTTYHYYSYVVPKTKYGTEQCNHIVQRTTQRREAHNPYFHELQIGHIYIDQNRDLW